jgi:hypothetical protein
MHASASAYALGKARVRVIREPEEEAQGWPVRLPGAVPIEMPRIGFHAAIPDHLSVSRRMHNEFFVKTNVERALRREGDNVASMQRDKFHIIKTNFDAIV